MGHPEYLDFKLARAKDISIILYFTYYLSKLCFLYLCYSIILKSIGTSPSFIKEHAESDPAGPGIFSSTRESRLEAMLDPSRQTFFPVSRLAINP